MTNQNKETYALLAFKKLENEQTLEINYLKPIDKKEIKSAEKQGEVTSTVTTTATAGTAAGAGIMMAVGGDAVYPVLKFMIIIKVINRLKFMNMNFGEILENFINKIGGIDSQS